MIPSGVEIYVALEPVDMRLSFDRLALTTTLTPTEEARRAALAAVAKKEAAAKAEMTGAVQVTAAALFHAYEANEVSADEQYKGKKLLVTGAVASIDKGGITGEAIRIPCLKRRPSRTEGDAPSSRA